MHLNGPDKKESRKVVVTKICFYVETKQKMKVCATKIQPDGPDKYQGKWLSLKYAFMALLK